ncbi:hypothetical protein K469DRAFT_575890, partial [Zopfia rhizophila CBS 207.26]
LYFIINIINKSKENNRRDVFKLLFNLYSKTKYYTVKVFIVSWLVKKLKLRRNKSHNFIRL